MNSPHSKKSAFTLIELIIVIAIVAILAAAVFVAIDPARRLHEARNAVRASDTATVLEAVKKYQADNGGTHYSTVDAITDDSYVLIGTTLNDDGLCAEEVTSAAVCANVATAAGTADCVDLSSIGATYLSSIPNDPQNGTDADTQYYIFKGAANDIKVGACDEEGEGAGGAGTAPVIEVAR